MAKKGLKQPGKRILVVEDHAETAELLGKTLEHAGYEVLIALTMKAALACAAQQVDIIVSDIDLPDGSGLELMAQWREQRPILGIALTGYGSQEDVRRSRAAGFHCHLVKPVDVPELLRIIEEFAAPSPPAGRGHISSAVSPDPTRNSRTARARRGA